ncbi:hypothetical protein RFI_15008 [Reticulomyxa filosa]|uniref:Uncharacterized protein n=1 Tax=Reticulomyxa filosa TaxID=46433 RepID=X6NA50_RETFI|nr:hypothetical protein RFI_15008 [Reticulomyxa filosa]|eukprot:ETO22192.1 hypothetical protein RFI_15008 [Reticulomyxa filosa]
MKVSKNFGKAIYINNSQQYKMNYKPRKISRSIEYQIFENFGNVFFSQFLVFFFKGENMEKFGNWGGPYVSQRTLLLVSKDNNRTLQVLYSLIKLSEELQIKNEEEIVRLPPRSVQLFVWLNCGVCLFLSLLLIYIMISYMFRLKMMPIKSIDTREKKTEEKHKEKEEDEKKEEQKKVVTLVLSTNEKEEIEKQESSVLEMVKHDENAKHHHITVDQKSETQRAIIVNTSINKDILDSVFVESKEPMISRITSLRDHSYRGPLNVSNNKPSDSTAIHPCIKWTTFFVLLLFTITDVCYICSIGVHGKYNYILGIHVLWAKFKRKKTMVCWTRVLLCDVVFMVFGKNFFVYVFKTLHFDLSKKKKKKAFLSTLLFVMDTTVRLHLTFVGSLFAYSKPCIGLVAFMIVVQSFALLLALPVFVFASQQFDIVYYLIGSLDLFVSLTLLLLFVHKLLELTLSRLEIQAHPTSWLNGSLRGVEMLDASGLQMLSIMIKYTVLSFLLLVSSQVVMLTATIALSFQQLTDSYILGSQIFFLSVQLSSFVNAFCVWLFFKFAEPVYQKWCFACDRLCIGLCLFWANRRISWRVSSFAKKSRRQH